MLQLLNVSATSAAPTHASLRSLCRDAIHNDTNATKLHPSTINRPWGPCPTIRGDNGIIRLRAVVVTVPVDVAGVLPLTDTLPGENVHVEPIGAPVQLRDTLPLNPFSAASVAVTVALLPAVTVAVVGVVSEKSGVVPPPPPRPLSATVCGLEVSLSAMLNVADSAPELVGLKKMSYVHDAPAASVALQVLDACPKSITLGPVKLVPVMVMAEAVALKSVTVLFGLVVLSVTVPKFRVVGDANTPVTAPGEILATKPLLLLAPLT